LRQNRRYSPCGNPDSARREQTAVSGAKADADDPDIA